MNREALHIRLRPLELDDASLLFTWRNDPFIVSLGSQNKTVLWEEHKAWITETVLGKLRRAYLILIDDLPAGQIRFDKEKDESAGCIISIYILKEFTGRGAGTTAIELGCEAIKREWHNLNTIHAKVLLNNLNGQKAFLKSGFVIGKDEDERHKTFVYCYNQFVPHNKVTFDAQESAEVSKVIESGYWASGNLVDAFEEKLCEITGRTYSIAVGSGLAALRISLIALGVAQGDEVIVPAYSCVALANAVLAVGGVPVPVDVAGEEFGFDYEELKRSITNKTKAIIAVHTFGVIADINELNKLGIPVIEDCAHAFGIETIHGTTGNMAQVSVCSFYATKLVGGGEGGAILTNDEHIAKIANDYRDYSDKKPSGRRLNDKMSNIHAALSFAQLKKLPFFIKKRKEIAERYLQDLLPVQQSYSYVTLPKRTCPRIWYRFPITVKNVEADIIITEMEKRGVAVRKPVELWVPDNGHYPNSVYFYQHLLSLPIYPGLSANMQERVVDMLAETLNGLL